MAIEKVDTILDGGTIITVDGERRVIRDGGIAIRGENLAFVGKGHEVSERYQAEKTVNCRDTPQITHSYGPTESCPFGDYRVTLTVTDSDLTDTATQTITIAPF